MDTLLDRIEQGMTTMADAVVVSKIIAILDRYEIALRDICAYGDSKEAALAARALAGDWSCQTEDAH